MILVKTHQTYREVVAVCDAELLNKKFEQGKVQLEITEAFFGGKELSEDEAVSLIKDKFADDACFNFAGHLAVQAGIKAGTINPDCVMKVQGIPYALALV